MCAGNKKMKKFFTLKTGLVLLVFGFLQIHRGFSQQVDLSVFSSSGGSVTLSLGGETVECYWNIGETITETFGTTSGFDASKKRLTQGFEQGEGFIEDPLATRIAWEEGEDYRVEIYPNPVRQTLYVRLRDESNREYALSLCDMQGRRLLQQTGLHAGLHSMETCNLHAGIYLLEVRAGGILKSFKLIKVS